MINTVDIWPQLLNVGGKMTPEVKRSNGISLAWSTRQKTEGKMFPSESTPVSV